MPYFLEKKFTKIHHNCLQNKYERVLKILFYFHILGIAKFG